MPEERLQEELASLRRRYEAAAERAREADQVLTALTALLGANDPDRIGETVFESFRALADFDRGFILTFDEERRLHCRFATHPVGALNDVAPVFGRVAEGAAIAIPDARRAAGFGAFLPAGEEAVSGLMFPFASRSGHGGLVLLLAAEFGRYSREQAGRLKRLGIVASQGLAALEELRLTRDFDRSERAREVARAANRAKSRFLEQVSHELRTPLNGVLGSAQVLQMRDLPAEVRASLGDIETCGRQMLKLVTDMIDYAAADDLTDRGDACVLDELIRDVAREYRLAAQAKDLTLEAQIDPRLEGRRVTGGQSLRRVLAILADNAVKYTKAGGVRLSARSMAGAGFEFSVTDTGDGMAPDLARSVFEPFARGDASSTRSVDGMGMGLPLARRLVRELGGAISLQTSAGGGSSVRVELPAALLMAAEDTVQPQDPAAASAAG